jgi:hypothetical protein
MSGRRAAVVAWSVFAVTTALILTSVVLAIADPKSAGPAELGPSGPTVQDRVSDPSFALLQAIVFSAFAMVGAIVAARRPRNAVGWLFGVAALFFALGEVANALFRPTRGRIQAAVGRRFYRRKYDAQRTLESFAGRMRNQVALDAIAVELRAVVAETIQPAHMSLWVRGR